MRTILSALLLVLIMAGTSFAIAPTPATKNGPNPKGFVPSHNVDNVYQSGNDPSTQLNDKYAVSTKHINGDKIFGSISGSGTIYFAVAVPGTALVTGNSPALGATSTDSVVTGGIGGWTAM